MMRLLYLFFIYSFLGWVLETVSVALKQKKIVNRGFLNGPFCMIYGFTAVILTLNLTPLRDDWFFLFLGSAIYATIMEFLAGKFLEKFYHGRWWDYSDRKWNFEGYVCFSHSMFWGFLGAAVIKWLNRIFLHIYGTLASRLLSVCLWALVAVLVVDILGTTAALSGEKERSRRFEKSNRWLARMTARLREKIFDAIEKRVLRAHPVAAVRSLTGRKQRVFGAGLSFYKLFWLFMTGAFLGDLVETVFCRFVLGSWMSRSSLVWGPFSVVWGIGIAMFTAALYQQRNRSDSFLFVAGTLLGGAFEYFCSVFTELVFGTIFWDYSGVPFNLAGRINLLYCFFWGIAAVVWFKLLLGKFERLIAKAPERAGKIATWIVTAFMVCNIAVSCLALRRYEERREGVQATSGWQTMMDTYYDDDVMKRIYPKAKERKTNFTVKRK